MNAVETLFAIRAAGGAVTTDGGRLVVDVDRDLPAVVWQSVAEHRDELVRLLEPTAATVTAGDRDRWAADPQTTTPADRQRWAEDVHARHPHPDGLQAVVSQIEAFVDDHKPVAHCSWEDPVPRHRDRHDLPAGVGCCDRCGATTTTDTSIHGGESVRQDCARCGRHRRFSRWHGKEMP
jgi:hypothetical protein